MVRNYQRKTNRVLDISSEKLDTARKLVKNQGVSIRAGATAQGLDRSTFARYLSSKQVGYEN